MANVPRLSRIPLKLRFALQVGCITLLLALLTTCTLSPFPQPTPTPSSSLCSAHTSNPVSLTMYYSSEKEIWIDQAVAAFNKLQATDCNRPITVKAIPIGSGESMQQIVNGTIQPDIWSPAGRIWLTLMNQLWSQKYGTDLISAVATATPSLVQSPVVIAMWKSEAEALGWPGTTPGWSDLARLSTDPRGWAAYGHPEWGDFKFAHTRPDTSNSGLDAVAAENYAGSNEARSLTLDDVNSPQTKEFVANVESSVIYYGGTDNITSSTGFLAGKMFCNGPQYLSAAVLYENLVVEGNEGKVGDNGKPCNHLADQVVAIYPKEGTFYSEHPFVIPQASWITPAKKAAALVFRDFLLAPAQQRLAVQDGFRPGNLNSIRGAPLDAVHGVDPSKPEAILPVPPADVALAVQSSWKDVRRKVDVMLILDRSGSMNDPVNGVSKIEAAKQGLITFVNLLGDLDGLGLTTFSTQAEEVTPVSPLGEKRQSVLDAIKGIVADGDTRLFDTMYEQWQALESLPSKHIKALIVLTDGLDNRSQLTVDQLISKITPSGGNKGEGIKIFTIAYGNDADVSDLQAIAQATGGVEYAGTPQNIQQVYAQISGFF